MKGKDAEGGLFEQCFCRGGQRSAVKSEDDRKGQGGRIRAGPFPMSGLRRWGQPYRICSYLWKFSLPRCGGKLY